MTFWFAATHWQVTRQCSRLEVASLASLGRTGELHHEGSARLFPDEPQHLLGPSDQVSVLARFSDLGHREFPGAPGRSVPVAAFNFSFLHRQPRLV